MEGNMNKKQLHDLIKEQQPNICQISCYKDGKEVYSDEWNNYKKTDTCHVMSATKSIVALLVGIAIDKGYIKSIEQPVLDFFPDYKIKRGEKTIQKVTIKHLLTMMAPYKYKYEPWTKICSSDDWTISALDFLGGRKGLTGEFQYSTLGIHILTGIISKTSGLKVVDFANKYLFEPIGIEKHMNYLAETAEEHKHFTMCKDPKTNVWFCDPKGVGAAGYGLCFSAIDMAKIGQLCLDQGFYKEEQIISSQWIKEMIKPNYRCGEEFGNMSYGYLWWIIDEKKQIYSAIGNSGNVIYVNPSNNIVIAVTSYFKPTIFDRIDFIQDYIEPYIMFE
jgi:CubicO group peptidase (beta-lactamase class C family)